MNIDKQASCDDPFDQLLPVEEARNRLASVISAVKETEVVELSDALGRALSHDVVSPINVPGFTNSAMDGFAINAESIPSKDTAELEVIGTAWAGNVFSKPVGIGQAVRVFTGAVIPEGADTVVIQEHVVAQNNKVTIDSTVEPKRNVRLAGEDVLKDQTILEAGTYLGVAEVSLLASLGIAKVDVYRKLKVAFFTTGDELCALETHAGKSLAPGMLFDSNRYSLQTMLSTMQVETIDMGIVRDDPAATRVALQKAAQNADIIVTSGGISAGDADFVTQVFHELGEVSFWKLAMRPGRPLAFGQIGDASFFGLPGNPVAVMVTFLQFVQPAIKRRMGLTSTKPFVLSAQCQSRLRKSLGRVEYQRGILSNDDTGSLVVSSTGKQGAGRISSMSAANCLIVIAADVAGVEPGDTVEVQPFYGLFS